MPPGLATCFGNSGLAAVTSISWGQNPNMGAIGDQWVRKWGWFISFLRGRGCWRWMSILFNFISCVAFHLKTGPLSSKWNFVYKVASGNKGWVMAYWFGFGGLTPFLVCKMFFAGFENDLCALKCALSMREESKLSMGHLQSLLGLAETSWASETSSSSSLDKGHPSRPLHHCPPLHLPWV